MPDTGERREITGRVNAKEAEVVQQSKKLASKTRQLSANMDAKNRERSGEGKLESDQKSRKKSTRDRPRGQRTGR